MLESLLIPFDLPVGQWTIGLTGGWVLESSAAIHPDLVIAVALLSEFLESAITSTRRHRVIEHVVNACMEIRPAQVCGVPCA
jgi:hypothetical protein